MPLIEPLEIWKLEQNAKNVRNISLFAHVDHGKSSLADHLIASNGVFHTKMASKMRYLDYRPDEIQRGITMKSAGISLIHKKVEDNRQFVFHLIDNPGHLDFIQETFLTSYLTDGAIFLVDVVEGLTLSGRGMLFKLLDHRIPIVLVLNKMDRLIIERQMTPSESYDTLIGLISKINHAVGEWHAVNQVGNCDPLEVEWFEDFFHPLKSNVVFCSASDGWAFRTIDFANLYSDIWGIPLHKIHSFLWGPFYPNPNSPDRASTISKLSPQLLTKAKQGKLNYCSVEWMFRMIWTIYSASGQKVVPEISIELDVILSKLKINLNPRDKLLINSNKKKFSPKDCVSTVFRYWLPVSRCILEASIECFPDPILSARYRLNTKLTNNEWFGFKWGLLVYPSKRFGGPTNNLSGKWPEYPPWCNKMNSDFSWEQYVFQGEIEKDQLLAFNCKLITAEERDIIRPDTNLQLLEAEMALNTQNPSENHSDAVILGICRVYSGYLKPDADYFIRLPKNDGNIKLKIKSVFILMGRSYAQVPLLYPGSIGAIEFYDLDDSTLRQLRLFTFSNISEFPDLTFQSEEEEVALIKVALEPEDPRLYNTFLKGLDWLSIIDPAVNIEHLGTGENVLICAGELHLERCINDLKEYLNMSITVSEPLVPFRECVSMQSNKLVELDDISFKLTCFNTLNLERPAIGHVKYNDTVYEVLLSDSKKKNNLIICNLDNDAIESAICSGFQLACANGPLCHEPLLNVGFLIEDLMITENSAEWARYAPLIRDQLLAIIMTSGPRIALAMYEVDIDCLTESIGKVYQVVNKRKGFVVGESMQEGTNYFTIKAKIPVVESMGVSDGNYH
eukprot:NODE_20_length_39102_cov_0.325513.p3 type:complete len:846 gc:universal NODE_20_length_39102_cov_0.325513:27458-29995(+)